MDSEFSSADESDEGMASINNSKVKDVQSPPCSFSPAEKCFIVDGAVSGHTKAKKFYKYTYRSKSRRVNVGKNSLAINRDTYNQLTDPSPRSNQEVVQEGVPNDTFVSAMAKVNLKEIVLLRCTRVEFIDLEIGCFFRDQYIMLGRDGMQVDMLWKLWKEHNNFKVDY
ncbi:hypothetical protein Acr_00g0048590 [Actinidia rufa]|uniref:Uncharacterized protein n=1 Tax=Actinidia rufa TaxID=165716 RepID=A0A7J0DK35_9ERIC|nr:hypothetical protein Acr_00g0048590 [Actinidia rufa]